MDTEEIWALIIFGIVLYLVLRDVFCWYYKINERIKLQNDQIKLQQETNILLMAIGKKLFPEEEKNKPANTGI